MEDILDFEDDNGQLERRQLAGFWERVGASVIDSLIMIPIGFFGIYNMFILNSIVFAVLVFLANMVYKVGMESMYGATFGKMALKLEVVDAQNRFITLEQSLKRYSFYFVQGFWGLLGGIKMMQSGIFDDVVDFQSYIEFSQTMDTQAQGAWVDIVVTVLVFMSVFNVAYDAKKQAYHDKIAKTYVVKKVSATDY